jgi:hypothetical protein
MVGSTVVSMVGLRIGLVDVVGWLASLAAQLSLCQLRVAQFSNVSCGSLLRAVVCAVVGWSRMAWDRSTTIGNGVWGRGGGRAACPI